MTTEIVKTTMDPISAWPALRSPVIRRKLAVLSVEARSPAQSWADVVGTIGTSIWRRLEPLILVGIGPRFEAQARVAGVAARKGPWVSLFSGETIEQVPGRALLQSMVVAGQSAACWGVQSIGHGEEIPALEVTQSAVAVMVSGVTGDAEWADGVARRALDLGSRNDALFVAAVESLNGSQVAVRSFNSFGDPPGFDVVGDARVLLEIRDRIGATVDRR